VRGQAAPRAVVFDLDGTLIDTADVCVVVVQTRRREHGLPALEPDTIRASVSNGARALVSMALGIAEADAVFEEKRRRLLTLYGEVLGSTATLYPGIQELLDELQARAIPWGISTNKPREYTIPLLEKLQLAPAPGSVVCPEDVSRRKPDPEPLLLNCRQLGCDPARAVYIGDHRRDVQAGNAAGMFTIAAVYGYIEAGDDPRTWGADRLAASSNTLRDLLFSATGGNTA